ncbi:unnamed protein product [Peronospora farinosa]|uniref:PHD-type domain-containing protein n=1 Tax=Peronospora farinosa TaxID=134698 RepID=A0AAV0SPK7_9STRA|nr:unnamed protein product [Peronospora farinosa]CAI5704571.1 unnamed protein product [Peronospora farinosa]
MPRVRKKTRVTLTASDKTYAPTASVRRPSIKVKTRKQRKRRAPAAFSPTADTPPRKSQKLKDPRRDIDAIRLSIATPSRPEHKRLENKVKSQAHRLGYSLAFVEAYEAEGWRKSSQNKLKPNKELEAEHRKIAKGKRALIDGLRELKALNAKDPQVPPQTVFEDVHCSRCGSTDIEQDNDILLCDSPNCHRAYHQWCQTPLLLTANIPLGVEPWFCEVCLSAFECLKSINSVFGTTYETVDELFPELAQSEQQTATDASSTAQSGEESGTAPADTDDKEKEDEDEEEDEDFICGEGDDVEDDKEGDEKTSEDVADGEEEMAEEVPESAQDLLFLSKDDIIDMNHRSIRSKSASRPPELICNKTSFVGEQAAKIDRRTGNVVFGVVAELDPPVNGRYSRWRIDYRDGSLELLTHSKTQAAINRAAVEDSDDDRDGDGLEDDLTLIVRGKRKRNDVDYRQLNQLMFAGKDDDSEDDETFEIKKGSEEENKDEEEEDQEEQESAGSVSDQSSPSAMTVSHGEASKPSDIKPNYRQLASIN